jgi:hypothetical protein
VFHQNDAAQPPATRRKKIIFYLHFQRFALLKVIHCLTRFGRPTDTVVWLNRSDLECISASSLLLIYMSFHSELF